MKATDLTPSVMRRATCSGGSVELVEWRWPPMIHFSRAEDVLMVEMSLPPLAVDASACFPDLAPGHYCFMGRLFVRFPGVLISGRSEGGHIRVLRCTFAGQQAEALLALCPRPDLPFLQGLLNLRSDTLRRLMALAHRELTHLQGPSQQAVEAYHLLIRNELHRLFTVHAVQHNPGRLAPWQYRRIRERLSASGARPTAQELAQLCGISPRHLHRQFANLTGESVAGYVENFRMKQARDMLARPHIPIKAIAAACGFAHPNSFARAFRRATGVSPARFRRQFAPDEGTGTTDTLPARQPAMEETIA